MRRLWRRGVGGAAIAVLVSTALISQSGVTTNASWNDAEWVHSPTVGTLDCADPTGQLASRGEGRVLSGSLLGLDLDSVLAAERVEVTNNGTRARNSHGTVLSGTTPPDSDSDTLDISVLSEEDLLALTGLLQLNTATDAGVLEQFGQASSTGEAAGASGYLTDGGAINLDGETGGYPELGTIDLQNLLNSVGLRLGDLVANVTNVQLEVGAVAGRARIDGCDAMWNGIVPMHTEIIDDVETEVGNLSRDYLAASADAVISSPAVGALVTRVNGIANSINTAAAQLTGTASPLAPVIKSAVSDILNPLLGALSAGNVGLSELTVTLPSPSPLLAVTQGTITDSGGILTIDLQAGTVRVNTAKLVNTAFGATDGVTLNGLPANTDLLSDPSITQTLTDALTDALVSWVSAVTTAVNDTINGIQVKAKASVTLRALVPVANIAINIDGSLAALAAGTAVTATATVLGILDLALLNNLLSALNSGLGPEIAAGAKELLPTVPTLIASLDTPVAALETVVSQVYTSLFIDGVVQVLVNAQNIPNSTVPTDWQTLPDGRYDVAALRIGVLNVLAESGAWLYLGRGSVGVTCTTAQAAQPGSLCANY